MNEKLPLSPSSPPLPSHFLLSTLFSPLPPFPLLLYPPHLPFLFSSLLFVMTAVSCFVLLWWSLGCCSSSHRIRWLVVSAPEYKVGPSPPPLYSVFSRDCRDFIIFQEFFRALVFNNKEELSGESITGSEWLIELRPTLRLNISLSHVEYHRISPLLPVPILETYMYMALVSG